LMEGERLLKFNLENINSIKSLELYIFLGVTIWTCIAVLSLIWNIHQVKIQTITKADIMARLSFDKDTSFRTWATFHGGVYVPITEETKPNQYLKIPDRDIKSKSGKSLTLMNPAYMMRQYYEKFEKKEGIKGHITSLKPLRPENYPDPWEEESLKSFEKGANEATTIQTINNIEYVRLMKPFFITRGCLKCHGEQGYNVGDIRGGISTSVPIAMLRSLEHDRITTFIKIHVFFWLIGIIGIAVFGKQIIKKEKKRYEAEESLAYSAIHDALTGLLNRRSLEEILDRSIARSKRKVASSLLYMDFDNFKDVNDTIGHSAGDDALVILTGIIKEALRTEDIVFRVGGDEFAVLLEGVESEEALLAAERLRTSVESYLFKFDNHVFPLTLSIGLVEINGTLTNSELLSRADAAMYKAKKQGKNRIVVA
jgi:diguanylate cyclase (GGDEF)-like protein